ncbi:hypothetical protein GW777_06855 [Candidatus Peregrinibacteria bacterium]|nr:hypothetical protein [Candidatus Parcubacteria bacterium]NCS68072.1 hypothetical protein [Candidatus Peregrinibacteria bacterium]
MTDYNGSQYATNLNNITTDPGFISTTVSSGDYLKIQVAGPAYNQGGSSMIAVPPVQSFDGKTIWSTLTVDYYGNLRPSDVSYDIGAYEYLSDLHDGDINLDGTVDTADALLALRIVIGDYSPSPQQFIHGDVAPLIGGIPVPDGVIDIAASWQSCERLWD